MKKFIILFLLILGAKCFIFSAGLGTVSVYGNLTGGAGAGGGGGTGTGTGSGGSRNVSTVKICATEFGPGIEECVDSLVGKIFPVEAVFVCGDGKIFAYENELWKESKGENLKYIKSAKKADFPESGNFPLLCENSFFKKGIKSQVFTNFGNEKFNALKVKMPFSSDLNHKVSDGVLIVAMFQNMNNRANMGYVFYFSGFSDFTEKEESLLNGNYSMESKKTVYDTLFSENSDASKEMKYWIKKSLDSCFDFNDLYVREKINRKNVPYINFYLEKCFNEQRSPFAAYFYENDRLYSDDCLSLISAEEGNQFASVAERYLNCAAEYKFSPPFNEKIFFGKKLYLLWEKHFKKNEKFFVDKNDFNGNPMPYSKGGFDTPVSFWKKMYVQNMGQKKFEKSFNKIIPKVYDSNFYVPGGESGKNNSSGCDCAGFFTGCVFMSGFYEKTLAGNSFFNKPLKSFYDSYEEKILEADKKFINEEIYKSFDFVNSLPAEIEKMTCIIPDINKIRRGDILTDFSKNGNLKICIVLNSASSMNEMEVVTVEEKKYCTVKKCFWSELESAQNYVARRILLVRNDKRFSQKKWDLMSNEFASGSFSIRNMFESDMQSIEKWRWIPNTGEYLKFSIADVVIENSCGVNVSEGGGKIPFKLILKDRNFDITKKSGNNKSDVNANVYNNNIKSRFVLLLETKSGSITSYGVFKLSDDDSLFYTLIPDALYPEGTLVLKDAKPFTVNDEEILNFYIRPESFDTAFPGDDIIMCLVVNNSKEIVIEADPSEYFAVYDKKMLWRANLYINKDEDYSMDWNDLHPWNVPPAQGANCVGEIPFWWDSSWGYNVWNRFYDGTTDETNVSQLTPGNGGQTVSFVEFTPLRTIPFDNRTNPDTRNKIKNTVAYSFPSHGTESYTGDSGSMDSPFDYLYKMKKQRDICYEADSAGVFTAPGNKWDSYKKGSAANNEVFIPGLGLYHMFSSNDNNEKPISEINYNYTFEAGTDCVGFVQRCASYTDNPYVWRELPVGIMESEENSISNVLAGYAGEKIREYPNSMEDYLLDSYRKIYAVDILKMNLGTAIMKNGDVEFTHISDEQFNELMQSEELKNALLKIVPGDIFVKDSSLNINTEKRDHIALIASVPFNASELTCSELLNSIILIEAEYSANVQSVIKSMSLGDYANGSNLSKVKIYDDLTFGKGTLSLNCQEYSIRRLR